MLHNARLFCPSTTLVICFFLMDREHFYMHNIHSKSMKCLQFYWISINSLIFWPYIGKTHSWQMYFFVNDSLNTYIRRLKVWRLIFVFLLIFKINDHFHPVLAEFHVWILILYFGIYENTCPYCWSFYSVKELFFILLLLFLQYVCYSLYLLTYFGLLT